MKKILLCLCSVFLFISLIGCQNDDGGGVHPPCCSDVNIDKNVVKIGDEITITYYTEPSQILDYIDLDATVDNGKLISIKDNFDATGLIIFGIDVSDDLIAEQKVGDHIDNFFDFDKKSQWKCLNDVLSGTVKSQEIKYYNFDKKTRITTVTAIVPNGARTGFIKINEEITGGCGTGFCPTKLIVTEN